MQIKTKAQILTASSKGYEINGNKGTSHKVRVMVDGEIFPLFATEAQVVEAQKILGTTLDVVLDIVSPKENTKIVLNHFVSK